MKTLFRGYRHRGITLVEIMVAVGILAVLFALTMKTVTWSVGQSYKLRCLTNLRQINVGAIAYSADNKTYLPLAKTNKDAASLSEDDDLDPDTKASFSDTLMPYMLGEIKYKSDGWRVENVYYEKFKLFECPSATRGGINPDNGKKRQPRSRNGQILDYGMNNYGHGKIDWKKEKEDYLPSLCYPQISRGLFHPKASLVANASAVYMADAEYDESPEDSGGVSRGKDEWPLRYSMEQDTRIRHLGGYNTVSLDGATYWRNAEEFAWQYWVIKRR